MSVCFYCLGEHETSQCVAKAADRITSAIDELGYRSLDELAEIARGIEKVKDEATGVKYAIEEFSDLFKFAHAETIWRMEKQNEILTGIHDIIQNPRATQANELYKMGAECLRRNKADDAMPLLDEAKKLNPLDYRIHVAMGHVYLQGNDIPKAIECFLSAKDYARTNEYRKDALLLISRGYRCLNEKEYAIQALEEALYLMPDEPQVCYELATISEETRALQLLEKAISEDKKFFVLAKVDEQLNPIRPRADALLERLYDEARSRAENTIADIQSVVENVEKWYCDGRLLARVEGLKKRLADQAYFRYVDAIIEGEEIRNVALASYEKSKDERASYSEVSGLLIDYLNVFIKTFQGDLGKYQSMRQRGWGFQRPVSDVVFRELFSDQYNHVKAVFETIVKESERGNYLGYTKVLSSGKDALVYARSFIDSSIGELKTEEGEGRGGGWFFAGGLKKRIKVLEELQENARKIESFVSQCYCTLSTPSSFGVDRGLALPDRE